MAVVEAKALFKIGVLLVNYRQWDLTRKCVNSLFAAENTEIHIGLIDNNSPEEIPAWVKDDPRILFHRNQSNEGLTAGNNQAFKMVCNSGAEYIFILNNDTEVSANTPALLAGCLAEHPEVGIAAPAVFYASHPDKVWSAGGHFSRWRMSLKQIYNTADDLPGDTVQMDQVTGCAIMMRRDDYIRAGMQDPDLFVYYEDTDLCFRIRKLDMSIALIPAARVLHHVSISVGGIYSPFAVYFTHRNRYIIASRFLRFPELVLFTCYYVFVTLYKTFSYSLSNKMNLVYWMWLGLIHGFGNNTTARPAGLFDQADQMK